MRASPGWRLSTTLLLAQSLWVGWGETRKGESMRELLGWDEDSLLGKAKETGRPFATSHRQAGVQPHPGQQGSACIMVSWEDRCHHSEYHPPSVLFTPDFIARHNGTWCVTPL